MTAQELRVGNWVYNSTINQKMQVYPMMIPQLHRIEKEKGSLKDCNIKPIPLTEEILLKCGFVCFAESEVSKGFSIGTNPVTNDYMLTLTWLKDIFKNNLDNYPFFKNGHHVIKHLHQLQNLYYSLTGQELEIKK